MTYYITDFQKRRNPMKRRKNLLSAIVLTIILVSNVASLSAQEKTQAKEKAQKADVVFFTEGSRVHVAGEPGAQAYAFVSDQEGAGERIKVGDGTFAFVSSEMAFDATPVKGAPYSAEAVTESIQSLADGNRIVRKSSATVYRDSEGRTRREETIKAVGPYSTAGEDFRTVFINDPVSGTSYALNSKDKTAHKHTLHITRLRAKSAEAGAEMKAAREREVASTFEFRLEGGGPMVFGPPNKMARVRDKDAKKESLGTQMIEGVQAEGTRTTITIPAGEIGNELPINIISERWVSPELKLVVMSKQSDPRFGETTYRLTNINRSEPEHTLFEVPADYTVQEPSAFKKMPRVRARENNN